jgi:hypothetical protein
MIEKVYKNCRALLATDSDRVIVNLARAILATMHPCGSADCFDETKTPTLLA